jgi:spore germination protein YaaH/PKD repeat protein
MRKLIILCLFISSVAAGQQVSVHQQESEHYNSFGHTSEAEWDAVNQYSATPQTRAGGGCTLDKIVFGWHPYWVGSVHNNYDWSLLSDLSYFSYEVDASTGNALTTHGWATNAGVTAALTNNVRVNLCVTLFSNHATLLGSPTSRQTLITNLISLVQSRGAHGVNIDFEGIPSAESANFTSFMIDLSNQMHLAIPNSQVSTVLYAVDWNGVFDVAALDPFVDLFVIMGYDYYWSGSTTSGPNDPLYHFGTTYNYTLSRSISYYLDQGVTPSKLILGLPYYGREYTTSSNTVPTPVLNPPNSATRTYEMVRDNLSGDYTAANYEWDPQSFSAYYQFQSGADWKQCFVNSGYSMGKRMDLIEQFGIGGMGIWALGYDDGYSDYWDQIEQHFSACAAIACSDTTFDMGGPNADYYSNENWTYTIAPSNATALSLNFQSFDVELNFDTLWIFDGPDVNATLVGSYTGTNSPGLVNASGSSLTLHFESDGATVNPGWVAIWMCSLDTIPPTTTISSHTWETADFTASFTDADNGGSGLNASYWQVLDNDGTEWRANSTHGFFSDNFDATLHPDWTTAIGAWSIASQALNQSDENQSNSNAHTALTQTSTNRYLYRWSANMSGVGTNRRSGIHFFCDDPTLSNRGNSYFVYYRVDNNSCQVYKVVSNVWTLMTDDNVTINPSQWYDFKVSFDPSSGLIRAYMDDDLVSEWTDPSPHTSGNSISLRTGDANVSYDNIKVYTSRTASEMVTIGNAGAMVRYQNTDALTPSCRIKSLVLDNAENWGIEASADVDIDWTTPTLPPTVNDGPSADLDTTAIFTQLTANWDTASDQHSDLLRYWYAFGNSPGDSNTVAWTDNGLSNSVVHVGLSLTVGETYYVSIRTENGPGLINSMITSDGIYVDQSTSPPTASFSHSVASVCAGDSVAFSSTSTNSTSWVWTFQNGLPATSTAENPSVAFASSGTYTITLIASGPGGSDTSSQSVFVLLNAAAVADFIPDFDTVYLPNSQVAFANNSTNSNSYLWGFGDGNQSTDANPWHQYATAGTYIVSLISSNGICADDSSSWIIVVLDPIGMSELNPALIRIYPNPFQDQLVVDGSAYGQISTAIHLYNAVGQLILSEKPTTKRIVIATEGLSAGTYLLEVWFESSLVSRKLVRTR